jgi:sulfite reductase beta subunit-like hemoprotein
MLPATERTIAQNRRRVQPQSPLCNDATNLVVTSLAGKLLNVVFIYSLRGTCFHAVGDERVSAMKKEFKPNLHTPEADFNKEERNKLDQPLEKTAAELQDRVREDLGWEAEQIAKSYGIYLEFNRAKTGTEKDWMYMLRVTIPGGGPISPQTWALFDELSEKYTTVPSDSVPSLRLTTRQNLQFHWVKKTDLLELVRRLASSPFSTLNGCGDNTRNVMACPLSRGSELFDANVWAQEISNYFQLPAEPFIQLFEVDPNYLRTPEGEKTERFSYGKGLLNRKFKIALSAVHRDPETGELTADDCVETRTNDVGISPVFEQEKLVGFQVSIGGGQGERNGKPTMAAFARPFAFCRESELLPVLDAIVKVHQEWGDRQNRHWARLKYVIKAMGIEWYREEVSKLLSFGLTPPREGFDAGARNLHHGWWQQKPADLWTYGAFIENGRISDASANGKLKTAIRELTGKYSIQLMITPNQDLLFTGIASASKEVFLKDLQSFGFGTRDGKAYSALRKLSGACVGRDTCRLAYTDSEKFEPYLIDELEAMGWGEIATSIGITGCERQCFRPATKAIGLVGTGLNMYQLKLLGTEDGRHQGQALLSEDGERVYMRTIPRDRVALVIDTLFKFYTANKQDGEELGYFHHRVGLPAVLNHLKENDATADLMSKDFSAENLLSPTS